MTDVETLAQAAQAKYGDDQKTMLALDTIVHDLKATEALNINNQGANDQVAYLLDLAEDATDDQVAECCEQQGFDPDADSDCWDLDDQVHEAKGEEAASINNSGLEAQCGYILEKMSLEAALQEIREQAA